MPSKRWKINRQTIEKLPVPAKSAHPRAGTAPVYYFDDLLKGFGVRVSPEGRRAFFVQTRTLGQGAKVVRVTLGTYPLMSPDAARSKARGILSDAESGTAPKTRRELAAERRAVEAARDAADRAQRERPTVADLLDAWIAVHVEPRLKPRTVFDYRNIAEKILKPAIGARFVVEIERADMAAVHHGRRATPRRANYELAVARAFFSYLEDAGHRPEDSNPCRKIKPFPEGKRERYLTAGEFARVGAGIDAAERAGRMSIFAAAALRLCLLTGMRSGEVTALKWAEVDLQRAMLLLPDSKTGAKAVYLAPQVVSLLAALPKLAKNPHVFPGERAGEPYQNLGRAWIKVRGEIGLDDVRLHDLRHSFASVAAGEHISLHVTGALLGHRVPQTTARYAHLAADPLRAANDKIVGRIVDQMTARPAKREDEA